ncbi:NOP8 [Candida pseudojiufengensis]|uniref:NOP8 n=1 Tax=Candida pseudojiufengensis TaxID=497109 RepID=UPI002224C49F|nr:NOP8 [Candida pseudojiufengensis]KAI5963185.1 NOP8 [Candida pseudojiufengensis]
MSSDEIKQLRIHIGNISPKLKENPNLLESRIEKFNFILIKPLTFHTKPLQLKYFAFITIESSTKEYEKFKNSLNGVVFMGLKLNIALAKPEFKERFKIIKNTPEDLKNQLKQSQIVQSRTKRIEESRNKYPINSITSHISTAQTLSPIISKSEHTFQNNSANTKNLPPTQRLNGSKSYGSTLNSLFYKYSNGKSHSITKGIHRKSPRKELNLKNQTLRILINGELKQFKFYKTKLWGYEKNRNIRDLTWEFDTATNSWKSGYDHIIEKSTSCGINGKQALSYGQNLTNEPATIVDTVDEDHESKKNKSILASILTNYDFNKPIEIEENNGIEQEDIEIDSKGRKKVKHYDYEIEGKNIDEDEDENENKNEERTQIIEQQKDYDEVIQISSGDLQKPQEEIYYDEDDEGNDIDFTTLKPTQIIENDDIEIDDDKDNNEVVQERENKEIETVKDQILQDKVEDIIEDQVEQIEENSDEEEFIPTFGSNSESNKTTSNTETLRSLFNPTTSIDSNNSEQQQNGFKLALSEDDEDIDNSAQLQLQDQEQLLKQIQKQQNQQQQQQQPEEQNIKTIKNNKDIGLFWPHFESPFLSTQSQFSKIGNIKIFNPNHFQLPKLTEDTSSSNVGNEDETEFEKWFWFNRGEFSREFKRRRRDVLRILKKKQK